MNSGVYSITNLVNNKRYIGSSIDLFKREKRHFSTLKKNTHFNSYLQQSFNKYGQLAFSFEVLEYREEDLLKTEEKYINFYNASDREKGYNLISHPTQGNRGLKWSQQSKDKLSNTLIQQYVNNVRSRVRPVHSEEAKKKIAKASLGRIPVNRKKIWCHQTGLEYSSIHEAAKHLNICVSGVMDAISKNIRAVHGYTFEYVLNSLKERRPMFLTSRSVVCLETGICFDSPSKAAREIDVAGGEIGRKIREGKKIKGLTFIYEDENE
jgi:group I intron endonuclease